MKIIKLLEELLPKLTPKEDYKTLKMLRTLHKVDKDAFNKKLDKINLVRKSEGLRFLHKNEVIGASIKRELKSKKKEAEEGKEKKEEKIVKSKGIKLPHKVFHVKKMGYYDLVEKDHTLLEIPIFIDGEKSFIEVRIQHLFHGKEKYKIRFMDVGNFSIVKLSTDRSHSIEGKEIIYPEYKKKVVLSHRLLKPNPKKRGKDLRAIFLELKKL